MPTFSPPCSSSLRNSPTRAPSTMSGSKPFTSIRSTAYDFSALSMAAPSSRVSRASVTAPRTSALRLRSACSATAKRDVVGEGRDRLLEGRVAFERELLVRAAAQADVGHLLRWATGSSHLRDSRECDVEPAHGCPSATGVAERWRHDKGNLLAEARLARVREPPRDHVVQGDESVRPLQVEQERFAPSRVVRRDRRRNAMPPTGETRDICAAGTPPGLVRALTGPLAQLR